MSESDIGLPLGVLFILLFILVLLNGFFVAAEMALRSVNRNKLKSQEQQEHRDFRAIQVFLEEPDRFFPAIQVVITLANLIAGALAAVVLSGRVENLLFIHQSFAGRAAAVLLIVFLLSGVFLVLGELYPKRIGRLHAEKIAMGTVGIILFFSKLLWPFVWFLSLCVRGLLRLTRQKVDAVDGQFSEDQVMSMLEVGRESGVLKEEGQKMITSIFAFDDKLAYEIMTPRTDVFSINISDPTEVYIDELMELRYSRIPVYEEDSDKIIGILHIKDYLIKAREEGFENVDIGAIIRKPYFVPETKNIDSLFFELQKTKQHIAILIDEYGGFSGIVTMEDIIEEVMGEIDDEYDEEEQEIEKINDTTYRIDGSVDLDEIEESLEIQLESENSETLGGFIIDLLGEIPEEDGAKRSVTYQDYVFTIESVKDRRIEKVLMEKSN